MIIYLCSNNFQLSTFNEYEKFADRDRLDGCQGTPEEIENDLSACLKMLRHAIKQIHDKNYYGKYQGKGKKIILLGLAFSGKDVGCRMDALES
jgi:hypothetical protein